MSKAELATCAVGVLSFVDLMEEWPDGMMGFSVLSDSNCFGRVRKPNSRPISEALKLWPS